MSYLSLQTPALLPKLSEEARIPSNPSHRRKQRLVICLATVFVSNDGSSFPSDPLVSRTVTLGSRSDAADTADVNDPDLMMLSGTGPRPVPSIGWNALILFDCLA